MENNKKKLPKIINQLNNDNGNNNENDIVKKQLIKKIQNYTDKNDLNNSDKSSDKSFSSISCNSIDLESDNEKNHLLKPIAKRPLIPITNNIFREDNKNYTDESFILPKYISKLQSKRKQSNLFTNFK